MSIVCSHSFAWKFLGRLSRTCQDATVPYLENIHDPGWLRNAECQMLPTSLEPKKNASISIPAKSE